jgi:hypothetical protein
MRIFFGVTVRVVHPVQNGVGPGTQVRRTLGNIRQQVEEPFPEFVHGEHFVGRIPMKEECLAEEGEVPVSDEESNDENHLEQN